MTFVEFVAAAIFAFGMLTDCVVYFDGGWGVRLSDGLYTVENDYRLRKVTRR